MSESCSTIISEVSPMKTDHIDQYIIDSEEDEVFFGPVKSEKELNGKKKVDSRRETLKLNEPVIKVSSKDIRRKSNLNDNIPEEDESDDKENLHDLKSLNNLPCKKDVDRPLNFQSPLSKFPALLNRLGIDAETDDSTSSIVDVENDQMFDNSIFTEYDVQDLSIMSLKISKNIRSDLKREKKAKNKKEKLKSDTEVEEVRKRLSVESPIPSQHHNEEGVMNDQETLESNIKYQKHDSSLERTSSHGSATSDWFNTTREEMLLYEKFGADYDLVVEKMSTSEKISLKKDLESGVPRCIEELLGDQADEKEVKLITTTNQSPQKDQFILANIEDGGNENVDGLKVNHDEYTGMATPESIKVLEETPHSIDIPRTTKNVDSQQVFKSPKIPLRPKNCSTRDAGLITPPNFSKPKYFKSLLLLDSPSYLRPTTSSNNKNSPKKKRSPSPTLGRNNFFGVGSANKRRPFDMAKIVSPVAQYIHTSHVPKLIRNIKPKSTKSLGNEILAVQEISEEDVAEKNNDTHPKKRYFKPLPEAEYKSSRVALEKNLPSESQKDLHKKFMTTNSTEAVVVRHVGKERVPQTDMNTWYSSPSNLGSSGTSRIVKTRESELFDETSVEMSIHEVKEINRLVQITKKKPLY